MRSLAIAFLGFCLLFCAASVAQAQFYTTGSIDRLEITSSDTALYASRPTDDSIEIEVDVTFSQVLGFVVGTNEFFLVTELVNQADEVVDSETTTIGVRTPAIPNSELVNVSLEPSFQLDVNDRYFVRSRLFREGSGIFPAQPVGSSVSTTAEQYFHFVNTSSLDSALNVLFDFEEAELQRLFAIRTSVTQQSFQVDAIGDIYRYDGFNGPAGSDDIEFVFTYELVDASTELAVATASNESRHQLSVNRYGQFGALKFGSSISNQAFTIDIEPLSQLDPVSGSYYVRVTGAHVERVGDDPVVAAQQSTTAERLLHFSGDLEIGGIDTTFTEVSNTPTFSPGGLNYINTALQVTNLSGLVSSWDSYQYGSDELLSEVKLMSNGAASVDTGSVMIAPVANAETDDLIKTAGDIKYGYSRLKLTPDGPVAGEELDGTPSTALTLFFPSGIGYTNDGVVLNRNRLLDFVSMEGPVALGPDFEPLGGVSEVPSSRAWLYQEGRPYGIEFDLLTFNAPTGSLSFNAVDIVYNHGDALGALHAQAALMESPAMAIKPSNEQYYRFVSSVSSTVSVTADFEGRALVTSSINLGPGIFIPHFPLSGTISWFGAGKVNQVDGIIQSDSQLESVNAVQLTYHQSCPGAFCEAGDPPVETISWTPSGGILQITPDGGLSGDGVIVNEGLEWGYLETVGPDSLYAHRTDEFSSGEFLVAGHALVGGSKLWNEAAGALGFDFNQGPSVLLLSGFDRAGGTHERFGTPEYITGLADYPGLNFRVTDFVQKKGYSRIGRPAPAQADFEFTPDHNTKYYVRPAGVSGIHEAFPGSFPPALTIYGYPFNLSNYGLSFLDSENHESQVNGDLSVPEPAGFSQVFEELMLSCVGELETAQLDSSDLGDKSLVYWNGTFQPKTMRFLAPTGDDACNRTGDPVLALGVTTEVAHVAGILFGEMGFFPDGQIVASGDGYPVDSRFKLPAQLQLDGPTGENDYTLTPVTELYFNDEDEGPADRGFVTFAATQDVPFFVDIAVQVMTSADSSSTAPFDIVGGWPDKGWSDSGDNFFTLAEFDAANIGWPHDDVASYDDYRRPSSVDPTDYTPVALQSFFGVLDFEYPLRWNTSARFYRSYSSVNNNLMVLNIDHTVDYLSSEFIEVSFGAQYDGVPQLNLSNVLYTVADQQLGAGQAFVEGIQQEAFDAIKGGIDGTAQMITARIDEFYAELFSQIDSQILDPLYDELGAEYQAALNLAQNEGPDLFRDYRTTYADPLLDQYVYDPANPTSALLFAKIDELRSDINQPFGLVLEIDKRLAKLEQTLAAIAGQLYVTANGIEVELPAVPVQKTISGILFKDGQGDRDVINNLIRALIADFVEDPLGTFLAEQVNEATQGLENEIQQQLDELFAQAEPTLAEIERVVTDLREEVTRLRNELKVAGEIQAALNAIINEAENEIREIAIKVRAEADAFLTELEEEYDRLYPSDQLEQIPNPFEEYPREEVTAMLRQKLIDEIGAAKFVREIQYTLKQYLYDLNNTVENTIENAFAEVNLMVKELIAETVVELEKEINPMLSDLSDKVGSGQIDGVARFQGDSLVRLRLDGSFEWQVPEPLQFRGYLEYLQLDSDGPGSCGGSSGQKLTEVSMGALDVPLDWISPDMRADVGAKFSMLYDSNSDVLPVYPVGLGGSFQMTGGELNFETFTIFDLKAAAAFGATENYIAASAGMIISSYEASGGIFLGRACSADPILLVDPLAGEVIGDGVFTGGYAYGEAWIPISEAALGIPASCMFRVSAGIGAGVFYFVEGPVFGGRMLAGASGEALCAVSIRGDVSLVGVKDGGDFRFNGRGRLKGKVGPCPFCLKFSKTAKVKYDNKWSVDL